MSPYCEATLEKFKILSLTEITKKHTKIVEIIIDFTNIYIFKNNI